MMSRPWFEFYEQGVRAQVEIPNIGLADMFMQTTEKYPERPALIFGGKTMSYAEMNIAVEKLARGFAANGIMPGERVAIFMPNSANWVIAFYALMRLGAIVVQTNPLYVESELQAQMLDAGATGIVTIAPMLPRILGIRDSVQFKLVAVDLLQLLPSTEGLPPEVKDLNVMLADQEIDARELPWPQIDPIKDVAVLQYTGGTTGTSKGVMLSHRNLVANAEQVRDWIQGEDGMERILTVLPLFHVYALTACMNLAMKIGGAMVILPKFDVDSVLQHINDYQPTLFPGAPTMYVAINSHPRVKEYNVSSIRACLSGSAPLPVEVALKFGELTSGRLVEAYGLSEASPATHLNPLYHARVGSIGVPAPNTDAKIVDLVTGEQTLGPNEIGELVVAGDQVMLGYWGKPIETRAVLRDGWLYTGDIAKMDEDGFFYIVDRKKDLIISGGYNVYPRDVEEVLYEHPAIREAVCAGIPDEYWGEMVKAYIVLKDGQEVTEEELINFCKGKLAAYKVPKRIELRASLPRTAVGKVLRRFLIEEEKQKIDQTAAAGEEN